MKSELALRLLGDLMEWDAAVAEREFKSLQILATYKYDRYSEFIAGSRFVESLGRWLQQFETINERKIAYAFVRDRLLFITSAEIERLVEAFFPRFIYYDVLEFVAHHFQVPLYQALATQERQRLFGRELRRSLIVGVSDGARTDLLRRFNVNRISNDQVLLSPDADAERLTELRNDLCKSLDDDQATFSRVYLIDDFTASGTTFFRNDDGRYRGKLARFRDRFREQLSLTPPPIESGALIRIHHFLGTSLAQRNLEQTISKARADLAPRNEWFGGDVISSFGHLLSDEIPLVTDARLPTKPADQPFLDLCEKYYDPSIEKPDHKQVDLQFGFKSCGLPLVLEHNTPNNSITLIWKESEGSKSARPMYSLFRRRERH